jgi:inhibitor of cysteine peptidase
MANATTDQPTTPGLAHIQSVDILILESFPVQVHIVSKGQHPDSCTEIDQIQQRRDATDDII